MKCKMKDNDVKLFIDFIRVNFTMLPPFRWLQGLWGGGHISVPLDSDIGNLNFKLMSYGFMCRSLKNSKDRSAVSCTGSHKLMKNKTNSTFVMIKMYTLFIK